MDLSSCTIDDFGPVPVVQPASPSELGEIVRKAASDKQAVYPLSGRTALHIGLPPTRPGTGIDLRRLHQVIDYPARDMTITVQAGITLARLQEILRKENQQLPIDIPHPEIATLGGILAANISGSRRFGCGTLRDYVIGITVVNDQGQEVKAGGRVVKNVAGYDMGKLYIGSLGTLGIISQVTLKLRPLPEETTLVLIGCTDSAPVLDIIHRSRTLPVSIDLLNARALQTINGLQPALFPDAPFAIAVGFEEKRETVTWQLQQLITELPPALKEVRALVGNASAGAWLRLSEFVAWPDALFTFKANIFPSSVAEFTRKASDLPDELRIQAHAGNGIVIGHAPATLTFERAKAMLTLLLEWATAAQGNVVVVRCPPVWKASLPIWGKPRGDLELMRTVKRQLDPQNLFNPGRFLV